MHITPKRLQLVFRIGGSTPALSTLACRTKISDIALLLFLTTVFFINLVKFLIGDADADDGEWGGGELILLNATERPPSIIFKFFKIFLDFLFFFVFFKFSPTPTTPLHNTMEMEHINLKLRFAEVLNDQTSQRAELIRQKTIFEGVLLHMKKEKEEMEKRHEREKNDLRSQISSLRVSRLHHPTLNPRRNRKHLTDLEWRKDFIKIVLADPPKLTEMEEKLMSDVEASLDFNESLVTVLDEDIFFPKQKIRLGSGGGGDPAYRGWSLHRRCAGVARRGSGMAV